MKKLFLSAWVLALLAIPLFTSCEDDNDGDDETTEVMENLESGILNGDLEEDYTLDASRAYSLTSSFTIKDGATLTIPAGTNIIASNGGTDVFIAVMMGAMIDIQGTETDPVVMQSLSGEAGDWGGLTICGQATTSAGEDASAEVGGFIYGGTDDTDNSGSISYLVIKGTGAQINDESQYNGISFYAVGSGTTVDNVAIIDGRDDGVEFFGGSVSVTNLLLVNNEDDAIDWTEGWSGTVTNSYIEHSIEGFSTVVEGDKANANPKLTNLTAVSTTGGTALQFKKASGATITGLSLTGYDVNIDLTNPDYEGATYANIQIDGADADTLNSYNAAATVDRSTFDWADEAAINVETYEGSALTGSVDGVVTLVATTEYSLSGSFLVNSGASLIIPAGTKITADAGGTSVFIGVLMGGKIYINGSESEPVIMTSTNGTPGEWGGLTICGQATTSAGENASAEVGGFVYGGTDDADNSGSISYLQITGTGAQINDEAQYNGISFYAVGSSTIVENIAVINGSDDGVEFFGGAVEVKNIYIENCQDDAVDWTEGWSGGITNTYISHTSTGFSTAFEGDKANNWPYFKNVTSISTVGGIALQFKKASGAAITGLHLSGYDIDLDFANWGNTLYEISLENVTVDGSTADASEITVDSGDFTFNSKKDATAIDKATLFGWVVE